MKKITLYLGMMLSLCLLQSQALAQNLVMNGSFEAGTPPQPPYNEGFVHNWVTNWTAGYTQNSGIWLPQFLVGGTPDIFDYSIAPGTTFGPPPNFRNDLYTAPIPPTSVESAYDGDRFAHLIGTNGMFFSGTQEGESILGRFTEPLCPGTYELKFRARAPKDYCSGPCQPTVVHPNNMIEVVLRIDGDLNSEEAIYFSPHVDVSNMWDLHFTTFTITPAMAAAGYNRIEFRIDDQGPFVNGAEKVVFIDDVDVRRRSTATISCSVDNVTISCGQSVDLWAEVTSTCLNPSNFTQTVGNPIEPGPLWVVSPTTDATYVRNCYSNDGCLIGCNTVNVTVIQNQPQTINQNFCEPGWYAPPTSCHDDNVLSYVWLKNGVPPDEGDVDEYNRLYVSEPGTYQVTKTYQNGCTCTTIINVTFSPPPQTVNHTIKACPNEQLTLNITNILTANNLPLFPNGLSVWDNSNPPSSTISITAAEGVYTATVYDVNGCVVYTINCVIELNILPPQHIFLCPGDSYIAGVPMGSSNPQIITNDEYDEMVPGIYILNVGEYELQWTDANGDCFSKTYSVEGVGTTHATVIVNEEECPACITVAPRSCPNGYWKDDPLFTGSRTICATDLNPNPDPLIYVCYDQHGCKEEFGTGVSLTEANILIQQKTVNVCAGQCVTLDPSQFMSVLPDYIYEWSPSGSSEATYTICPEEGGSEFVKVYDKDGCLVAHFEFIINIIQCKKGTTTSTMPVNAVQSSINIYPNPSSDVFNLELKGYNLEETSYTIVDAVGREVMTVNNIETEVSNIDLTRFDKGIYFIRVKNADGVKTRKIIIQ